MKKLLLFLLVSVISISLNAQVAKKYVLIEHFTQASCGPCAADNPIFKTNILNKNIGKIHYISYHTSWPGTDPMYNHNTQDSKDRVTYYGVSGVPDHYTLGKDLKPTQADIDREAEKGSPISVNVVQTKTTDTIFIKVTVNTLSPVPSGNYVLRTVVHEKDITYATPPGSNGEKFFPSVMRKMLPSAAGVAFNPAPIGDSIVYNFSYPISSVWDKDSIQTIAFVQNNTTKEVLNSGASFDVFAPITNAELLIGIPFQEGRANDTNTFKASIVNHGNIAENFIVKLTKTQPANWSATFTINGITQTDSVAISIPANTSYNASISITPGATAGIGTYEFSIRSVDNPGASVLKKIVKVISGVTDLIVSNEAGRGDGVSGNAKDWEIVYTRGLDYAGNTTYGTTNTANFIDAVTYNVLTSVKNVYYNVGFTFPSLTDTLVAKLASYLNNGGKLFISGQDIGWETMDANGNGTTATKAFYTNYLKATYKADGTSATTQIISKTTDPIFGTTGTSTIFGYYGSNNIYPDEIAPLTGADTIFTYGIATKVSGIKYLNPTTKSKVVYMGIGLEMLSDTTIQKEILKRSHDWFNEDCGQLTISAIKTNLTCGGGNDGAINIGVTGGTGGYTYLWSPGSETTDSIGNLSAGTYTVTITDTSAGCAGLVKTFTIAQPTLSVNAIATNIKCNGENNGSVGLIIKSGTPGYTYLWNTSATTQSLTNLAIGTYSVVITDDKGCTTSISKTISDPAVITIPNATSIPSSGSNGMLSIGTITGGTGAYSYSWDNGKTTKNLTSLAPGDYTLTVTDANGCTATKTFTVASSVGVDELFLEKNLSIYPNPAVNSTILKYYLNEAADVTLSILDLTGKQIVISALKQQAGEQMLTVNTAELANGVYYLKLNINDISTTKKLVIIK